MEINKRQKIQEEALEVAKKHLRTGLGISVGVGKTRIGLMHMEHLNDTSTSMFTKFLVVAPKKSIFESWKKEAEKTGHTELLDKIVFSTYRSINKHNPAEFSGVYLDECHNILETHTPFLKEFDGHVLGLTGTPPRYKNSEKGRLIQVYCPIRYTYITDDAVDDNILNDYRVVIHPLVLSNEKNFPVKNKRTGGVFYTSEVANYSYWNDRILNTPFGKQQMITRVMRMKSMMEYRSKEEYTKELLKMIDDKCIVFANTTEQADRLCKHTYHSKNPDSVENLEKFGTGEIDELSCVLQLSEGINIPNLKAAIVLHAYGNEKKLMQRLGRLMRLGPGEKATIHVLMYAGTQDQEWVEKALADLDQDKIIMYD